MDNPKPQPVAHYNNEVNVYEPKFNTADISRDLPAQKKDALRNLGLEHVLLASHWNVNKGPHGLDFSDSQVSFFTEYVVDSNNDSLILLCPDMQENNVFHYKLATPVLQDYILSSEYAKFEFQETNFFLFFSKGDFDYFSKKVK